MKVSEILQQALGIVLTAQTRSGAYAVDKNGIPVPANSPEACKFWAGIITINDNGSLDELKKAFETAIADARRLEGSCTVNGSEIPSA